MLDGIIGVPSSHMTSPCWHRAKIELPALYLRFWTPIGTHATSFERYEKVKRISNEEHEQLTKRCQPEKGDMLLSKNGTIGITKVIDWDFPFSIFVSLCLIKFSEQLNAYYFSYFFQSKVVEEQIFGSTKKTSVTNLHLDKIRELITILPPIHEQRQICEAISAETNLIETSVNKVLRQIAFLHEYRTTLISEVVTGKIDVRDEAIP